MTTPFDFKYVKRPMPDILDEIFAPFPPTRLQAYKQQQTVALQEAHDVINVALEIPRLERNTISVFVEKQNKGTSEYDLTVEATEIPLDTYLLENEKKAYKKVFKIQTSRPVALDGDLGLAYSEGVLVIEIPLIKPSEPKKQTLSARLSDIEN